MIVPPLTTQQPGNPDIVVPSINETAPDGKPDMGAYEFGVEPWTAGSTLKAGIKPPAAPDQLVATAVGANQINLAWADRSSNESGFVVERSRAGGAFEVVAQVTANGADFDDSGLERSTAYTYRVKAVNSGGVSAPTAEAKAVTPAETAADARISQAPGDAKLDDPNSPAWSAAPGHEIDHRIGDNNAIKSAAECSGTWKALWDDTALHLLIDVADDAVRGDPAAPWYARSGAEIYLDTDNSKRKSYDGLNDYQLGVTADDGASHFGASSAPNREGIVAKVLPSDGGYRVRVDLPWSVVLGRAPADGALIGLDVHLNHSADGKTSAGKRAWFAPKDNLSWTDPSRFATVELVHP